MSQVVSSATNAPEQRSVAAPSDVDERAALITDIAKKHHDTAKEIVAGIGETKGLAADIDSKLIEKLSPRDRKLFDQATEAVEKLNAAGAQLPVNETAASLAALAKQHQLYNIKDAALGVVLPDGKQNIIIGNGDLSDPATRSAAIDKHQAAKTPLYESIETIQRGNVTKLSEDDAQANVKTHNNSADVAPKQVGGR